MRRAAPAICIGTKNGYSPYAVAGYQCQCIAVSLTQISGTGFQRYIRIGVSDILKYADVNSGIVVLSVGKLTGSEVVKQQIERLFSLDVRLLADYCGQDTLLQ